MKKFLGCSCAAMLLPAIAIFALAVYLGIHTANPGKNHNKQATPVPRGTPVVLKFSRHYLGKWQSRDGTIIWIKSEGKGDFHWQNTDVTGGILTIDEKKKILKIASVFDDVKEWKVKHGPQNENGQITMILDQSEFRRIGSGDSP